MTPLFVKICGITRQQDADLASGLGATALGFVFWPGSPRRIEPDTAGSIAAQVRQPVMKIGVFVNAPIDDVARVVEEVGLDAVQLHGSETPEYCRELTTLVSKRERQTRVIKSIGLNESGGVVDFSDFDSDVMCLVDAHDPIRHGGTGRTVNWDVAREIAATRRTILAGGLNAANIRLAMRLVRPYGVDVSSGVESAPGVKDPVRLRSFFEALHG